MDPVAHTFTGAALAAAGLRRATPLATAALLIGANIPDVDVLSYFAGGFEALAFRRGWTHGVLALAVWPFVVTGALLLWDRWVRRRRDAARRPRVPVHCSRFRRSPSSRIPRSTGSTTMVCAG
jgi:inner membrane protein